MKTKTADERRKEAMHARAQMEAAVKDKGYCKRCSPWDKEEFGVEIVGKGVLCPHGKPFAPKV